MLQQTPQESKLSTYLIEVLYWTLFALVIFILRRFVHHDSFGAAIVDSFVISTLGTTLRLGIYWRRLVKPDSYLSEHLRK